MNPKVRVPVPVVLAAVFLMMVLVTAIVMLLSDSMLRKPAIMTSVSRGTREPSANGTSIDSRSVAANAERRNRLRRNVAIQTVPVSESQESAAQTRKQESSEQSLIRVRGSIVLVDGAGFEHTGESGSISCWLKSDGIFRLGPVIEFRSGRWETVLRQGIGLGISKVLAGGRSAVPESRIIQIPEDGRVQIRAHWTEPPVLRVRDKLTGMELSDVTVARMTQTADGRLHPGDVLAENVVAAGASSPLTLTGIADAPGLYAVWAKGHVWNQTRIDPIEEAETEMFLERGASLEVGISEEATARIPRPVIRVREAPVADEDTVLRQPWGLPSPDAADRVRALLLARGDLEAQRVADTIRELRQEKTEPEGQVVAEVSPEFGGTTRIEGLEPGWYWVCLEHGVGSEHQVLAREAVRLVVGQCAHVLLQHGDWPSGPSRVPLSGTLALPSVWNIPTPELRLCPSEDSCLVGREACIHIPLDETDVASGQPGLFSWNAGLVLPGRYRLELDQLPIGKLIEVGPPGRSDVVLEVGQAGDVVVRPVDAQTGERIELTSIAWRCVGPGVPTLPSVTCARNPGSGDFAFRAPVGWIRIFVKDRVYGLVGESVRVSPGLTEVRMALQKTCGVLVVLEENGKPVTSTGGFSFRLDQLGGDGWGLYEQRDLLGYWMFVDNAGRYRLTVRPRPEGFQEIPERNVEIKPGEFVEVVVSLTRKE